MVDYALREPRAHLFSKRGPRKEMRQLIASKPRKRIDVSILNGAFTPLQRYDVPPTYSNIGREKWK